MKPVQQAVQVSLLTFCDHLDLSIGQVFGVALKLEVAGVSLHETAVAHALNGSSYQSGQTHMGSMVAGAGWGQVSVSFRSEDRPV